MTAPSMSSIDFISQHKQLLAQLLDGRKELRREMLAYLAALDEVWAKLLQAKLQPEDLVALLKDVTGRFMDDSLYCMTMLDKRFDELLAEHNNADRIRLEEAVKRLSEDLARKDSAMIDNRAEQKEMIDQLMKDLESRQKDLDEKAGRLAQLEGDKAEALKRIEEYENLCRNFYNELIKATYSIFPKKKLTLNLESVENFKTNVKTLLGI